MAVATVASRGYDGRKGPRMETRGGCPPTLRPVFCPICHRPLGQKYRSPAVRVNGVLRHRDCR